MSYDEDPPEPTEEEIATAETEAAIRNSPTFRIEGLTLAHVDTMIRAAIESNYHMTERIEKRLEKTIDEHVSRLVDEVTRERIAVAVDTTIAEGFPVFDYNGREKERTTVKDLVMKELTREHGDGYGRKSGTLAQQAVANAIAKLFEKELADTITKIKADLKVQADEVFKAKLVAGMKEAIGLRS